MLEVPEGFICPVSDEDLEDAEENWQRVPPVGGLANDEDALIEGNAMGMFVDPTDDEDNGGV